MSAGVSIAAIVPCHNEEAAVGTVVRDLRAAVPGMTIYVYDNRSTDATSAVAETAGAVVRRGKLNTYRDGFKILSLIFQLIRHERPLAFHSILAGIVALGAVILGIPLVVEFGRSGLVPRFPTAFLAASLMIIAALTLTVGFVLDGITRSRRESARLVYLGYPAPVVRGAAATAVPAGGLVAGHAAAVNQVPVNQVPVGRVPVPARATVTKGAPVTPAGTPSGVPRRPPTRRPANPAAG